MISAFAVPRLRFVYVCCSVCNTCCAMRVSLFIINVIRAVSCVYRISYRVCIMLIIVVPRLICVVSLFLCNVLCICHICKIDLQKETKNCNFRETEHKHINK